MAKQLGIQMKGRIGDYSFYQDRLHGHLVRRTGGVTAKQYQTDQRYAAARAASSEFALVSAAGKLIRNALSPFIDPVKDSTMVNRLNKELVALKQLDNKHPRGKRKPETRIADADANKWLRIFQFNDTVKIYDLIGKDAMPCIHKTHRGNCRIKLRASEFPQEATHAGLTLVRTVIDFEKKSFHTVSSQMKCISKDSSGEVELSLRNSVNSEGTEIICLRVLFFREQNGTLVQLKEKVHSMGIIELNYCKTRVKMKRIVCPSFRRNTHLRSDCNVASQIDHSLNRKEKTGSLYLSPNDS